MSSTTGRLKPLPNATPSDQRLSKLYGELASSLDMITATLDAAGVNPEKPSARDLYERNLDCQNLGAPLRGIPCGISFDARTLPRS